jgi:hypothetical protein
MLRSVSIFRLTAGVASLLWGACGVISAQSVISAKSGVVHYVEGQVTLEGDAIHPKFGQFPEVRNGQVLSTDEGRAEVLLTPGVFLRLSENSAFRMESNALSDTRITVLSGTALIEVVDLLEHNAVTAKYRGTEVNLPKRGIYRIDADAASFRVYEGEARLNPETNGLKVKKGHEVNLDADQLEAKTFDNKETDPFYRWSSRRSSYIADANVTSARTASRSASYSSSLLGSSTGAWAWNPFFGMFTFMPASGMFMSPFGSAFYSPSAVVYMPVNGLRAMAPVSSGMNQTSGFPTTPASGGSMSGGSMHSGSPFSSGGNMRGAGGAVRMSPGGHR